MNEILLICTAILSTGFILVSWKLGKERLYSAIIIFLLLISTVGGKIVEFFGYQTNTGNIFYASVFLTTYFLIERYGKTEGIKSIWIGAVGVIFFVSLAKVTVALTGSGATTTLDQAIGTAFDPTWRISFASILAYTISQSLNVHFYIFLKEKWGKKFLWLRANLTNALAQTLDSLVFFLVAFWDIVLPANIGEIIIMSLVLKIGYMLLASPLLYFNTLEYEESKSYSSVSIS